MHSCWPVLPGRGPAARVVRCVHWWVSGFSCGWAMLDQTLFGQDDPVRWRMVGNHTWLCNTNAVAGRTGKFTAGIPVPQTAIGPCQPWPMQLQYPHALSEPSILLNDREGPGFAELTERQSSRIYLLPARGRAEVNASVIVVPCGRNVIRFVAGYLLRSVMLSSAGCVLASVGVGRYTQHKPLCWIPGRCGIRRGNSGFKGSQM